MHFALTRILQMNVISNAAGCLIVKSNPADISDTEESTQKSGNSTHLWIEGECAHESAAARSFQSKPINENDQSKENTPVISHQVSILFFLSFWPGKHPYSHLTPSKWLRSHGSKCPGTHFLCVRKMADPSGKRPVKVTTPVCRSWVKT